MKTSAYQVLLRASALVFVSAAFAAEGIVPVDPSSIVMPPDDSVTLVNERDDRATDDPLFPRKNRPLVSTLTGIPYVALAEYAHGFTDRFSIGVLAGRTPTGVSGFGIRVRQILAQPDENFRVHFKAPIIFYPQHNGTGTWWLAWPTVTTEWRRESGTRIWTGVGLVGATIRAVRPIPGAVSSQYGVVAPARQSRYESSYGGKAHSTGSATTQSSDANSSRGDVWNTLQLGFSKPISGRIVFQFEAAAVLKGIKLDPMKTWVAGPPVIVTTGLSYAF